MLGHRIFKKSVKSEVLSQYSSNYILSSTLLMHLRVSFSTDRLICPLVIICSQHGMHGSVNAARKHSIANLKTRGSVCTADSESPKAKFMLWQNPNILLRRTSICVKNRKSECVCVWGGAFSRIEEGSDKRAERRGEGDKVFSLKVCASFHFLGGVTVSCSSMEWEKQDGERLQCSTIPSFHPT